MGSGGREGVTGSAVCIGSTPGEKVQEKVRKMVLLALDLEEGSRRRDAGSVSMCLCSRRWFFSFGREGRRSRKERRWFCVPVYLFSEMVLSFGREGERSRKELLVLFLRMGQASGSWRRVSGGKESGKVSMSATWRFFSFLWTGRRRRGWFGSWRREPGRSWCRRRSRWSCF